VEKVFVGHVRFGADGAVEFAKGWDETQAPKTEISAHSRPELMVSRGWFDAYTSSGVEPISMESCRCGQKKSDLLGRRWRPNLPARPAAAGEPENESQAPKQ
jgi:hypothetical protein